MAEKNKAVEAVVEPVIVAEKATFKAPFKGVVPAGKYQYHVGDPKAGIAAEVAADGTVTFNGQKHNVAKLSALPLHGVLVAV